MRNKYVQISLMDTYTGVLEAMETNKSELVRLLEEYIDFEAIIPPDFYIAYKNHMGRKHINPLESYLRALNLKQILGMKEDKQLLTLLRFSEELQDYCGFVKLPDAPQLCRFKQDYCVYLQRMFEKLVEITEPICREINSKKADYLIFDTTGIEPNVKENNPKFLNTKLNSAKKMAKSNPDYDPYKGVYALLPDEAESAPMAKHEYINGHFCYAFKAGIVTNGLGVVRSISLFDEEFRNAHPDVVSPKSDDPEKDKEIGDSVALKPVLTDFFNTHKSFSYSTFLGDSSFDSYDTYSMLKNDFKFSRACIPLNPRNSKSAHSDFNEFGNPICPLSKEQFTCLGESGGKNRSKRMKWVCPKSIQKGVTRVCICETPCTDSSYGRCVYTYPDKDFRMYPGIARNTQHWDNLYKHRVLVERTINIFKDSFGLNSLKTQNIKTVKFDLFMAGCTQLIGVILANAINRSRLFKSIRKIVALTA
ncbi:MAG: ISNCY family transposase [Lachnospiraceae bacterium]|nr:ISNCY family transposase [Lachnospiraceae bacterium]